MAVRGVRDSCDFQPGLKGFEFSSGGRPGNEAFVLYQLAEGVAAVAVVIAAFGYAEDGVGGGIAAVELSNGLGKLRGIGDYGDSVRSDALGTPAAKTTAALKPRGFGLFAGGFGLGLLACSPITEGGGATDQCGCSDDRG